MRSILVSSSVFAAIWKARREGEDDEDSVLRRLLELPAEPATAATVIRRVGGFRDERNGVHFPQGMKIHRVYRGHRFEAVAESDRWFVRASGKSFRSLHQLTKSVNPKGNENAWLTWKYVDRQTHEEFYINKLRGDKKLDSVEESDEPKS